MIMSGAFMIVAVVTVFVVAVRHYAGGLAVARSIS